MTKKMQMKTRNLMVSLMALAIALLAITTVSAAEVATVGSLSVEINGVDANTIQGVDAGETIEVTVSFESAINASDVRIELELDLNGADSDLVSTSFDVEAGNTYTRTYSLTVPYEFEDELSDVAELEVKIWGDDDETEDSFDLTVQRPSYNVAYKSISVPSTINAGEELPVSVVLKNIGYNDLDDLYVVVSIPALNIEKAGYYGDLVSDEWNSVDDDDTDTVSGTLTLAVPYDVEAGVYAIEIEVSNDDMVLSETANVAIKNSFPETVIKTSEGLFIVNPTDSLQVYRVVFPESEMFVTVQAGSSETVNVDATSEFYTVNVLTMSGELVGSYTFNETGDAPGTSSAIVVLTIVLAIIFIVLLVVLIVLLGKKPAKSEEFGESYY